MNDCVSIMNTFKSKLATNANITILAKDVVLLLGYTDKEQIKNIVDGFTAIGNQYTDKPEEALLYGLFSKYDYSWVSNSNDAISLLEHKYTEIIQKLLPPYDEEFTKVLRGKELTQSDIQRFTRELAMGYRRNSLLGVPVTEKSAAMLELNRIIQCEDILELTFEKAYKFFLQYFERSNLGYSKSGNVSVRGYYNQYIAKIDSAGSKGSAYGLLDAYFRDHNIVNYLAQQKEIDRLKSLAPDVDDAGHKFADDRHKAGYVLKQMGYKSQISM